MTTEAIRDLQDRLASLYEEYYDKIARYVYSRIGDRTEAEDIASEVFVKALEALKTYREQGIPMQAWLFRIAHNLMVDHLRRLAKKKTVPFEKADVVSESDPAQTAETKIEVDRVKAAMEDLTPDQKEVLQLRFFGGLTSREVSVIMQKSDGAVREMQRVALEKLRQSLGKNEGMG
jgi:RNA polymerase sigma-70 factor (ECF subfamily)